MHFAILILLLVPGHVAEVPEPEAGCLLQSAQGQLLALEAAQTNPISPIPAGYRNLCPSGQPAPPAPCICAKHSMSTFYSARLTVLDSRPSSTRHTTQVSLATRRCALAAGPARNCGGRGKTGQDQNVLATRSVYAVDSGTVYGDPHIRTLDRRHYTLLQQGIFSLWHLSGLETEFYSEASGLVKKVPVNWQIYTRYWGCYWWTDLGYPPSLVNFPDLEDLRDRFSRSLQKSASGEPESKVESGQL